MFAPTRDEARRFLTDAWRKYRAGEPLSGLEQKAVQLIAMHAEYHAIVEAPDAHLERDYRPEQGDVNPFLHLSLHLAVAEQLAIGLVVCLAIRSFGSAVCKFTVSPSTSPAGDNA